MFYDATDISSCEGLVLKTPKISLRKLTRAHPKVSKDGGLGTKMRSAKDSTWPLNESQPRSGTKINPRAKSGFTSGVRIAELLPTNFGNLVKWLF